MKGTYDVLWLTWMVAAFVGCGGTDSVDETSSSRGGSCALVVEFRGREYEGVTVEIAPEQGRALGSAVLPACDSGDAASRDESIDVARLRGISPRRAIAWEGRNDVVLVRESEGTLPSAVAKLLDAPRCDPGHAPLTLSGPWLGIVGPGEETEVDLFPPYHVDLFVDQASHPDYERAYLTVRVPHTLGRPLTREDVHSSLREGGDIEVVATCDPRGRYVAKRLSAYPP